MRILLVMTVTSLSKTSPLSVSLITKDRSFKDNAGAKISAMEWLSKVEDAHLELTAEIQIYLDRTGASAPEDPTTQATSQSLRQG